MTAACLPKLAMLGGWCMYIDKTMKCPECLQQIHGGAPECPQCGMTLERLRPLYARVPLAVNELLDIGGVFGIEAKKEVQAAVLKLRKKFPLTEIAVASVNLRDGQTLQSFGFFLLNAGRFSAPDVQTQEGNRALLVFDVQQKTCCLFFGYRMDAHVREMETFNVLTPGHPYLIESEYLLGTEAILKSLGRYLVTLSRRSRAAAKKAGLTERSTQ